MSRSPKDAVNQLYEIAAEQQGFFTAKQAKTAGFQDEVHGYHVKAGDWIREIRGIYRLAKHPPADRPDLVVWSLWSRNRREEPQGVYSHQTALGIYDLSDLNPASVHMTVPVGFRRRAPVPRALVLHFGGIPESDIETMQGYRVTKPIRAIVDCLSENKVSVGMISQAFDDAFKNGLISKRDVERRVGKIRSRNLFTVLVESVTK